MKDTVREFLDAQRTMTLAVVDGAGPWAADVYYVRTGAGLAYFSSPKSRHAIALATDPRAAATVHAEAEGWRDIRGVQMEGTVEPIAGEEERKTALDAYLANFPFAKPLLVGELLRKVRFYVFRAETVLWIANERGLGERVEVRGVFD